MEQKILSENEWLQLQNYLNAEVSNLNIPSQPEIHSIAAFASRLDTIKTYAVLQYTAMSGCYEYYNNKMKNLEEMLFPQLKKEILDADSKSKCATEKDISGKVVDYLNLTTSPVEGVNLPEFVLDLKIKTNYLQRIVEILKGKQDLLITPNLILKIESNM